MNKNGVSLVEMVIATALFALMAVCVCKMEADFYMHQAQSILGAQRYGGIVALRNFFENTLPAITCVAAPAKTGAASSVIYGYSNTVWNNTSAVYNSAAGQQTLAACVTSTCPPGVTGPYCAYYAVASGVTGAVNCGSTGWTFITGGITTTGGLVFSRDDNGPQEVLRMNADFNLGNGSTGTITSAIQIATGS
jgi:hypothetical protein